ncbi:MAG: TIGR01212 family radical SAM protein [Clostridia bacterium]|nr:TIGR01212 family radical SAM protein [Clostridia bacterium]
MEKAYRTLNSFLKEKFGERIYKIQINGGFTCPNRDGAKGRGGCAFCNGKGAGEHNFNGSITEQINRGIVFAKEKNKGEKYIAYFQSFTSTYAPVRVLREKYLEALSVEGVVGLAVATRPDCIDEEVALLLNELSEKYYVYVELGLQTADDEVAEKLNRGYKTEEFITACSVLEKYKIPVVVHLIIGLPYEKEDGLVKTVNLINRVKLSGIKLHSLYVLRGTPLEKMLKNSDYTPTSREKYVENVCYVLTHIPKETVVHRLTGDGEKSEIVAPLWTTEKKKNLNAIDKYMWEHGLTEGCLFKGEKDE